MIAQPPSRSPNTWGGHAAHVGLAALLAVGLSACASPSPTGATQPGAPVAANSLVQASPSLEPATLTITPTRAQASSTPSRSATLTRRPTATLTQTPSPSPRPSVTPSPTATETPTRRPSRRQDGLPPLVAIDPGHGGLDQGAPHYNAAGEIDFAEAEINLAISLKVRQQLLAMGYRVVMMREDDVALNAEGLDVNGNGVVEYLDELQARIDLANEEGADLLLSIHQNTFYWENGAPGRDIGGTVTFYCGHRPFSEESRRLAELVQAAIEGVFGETGYVAMKRSVEDDLVLMTPGEPGTHLILLGPQSDRIARPSEMPGALSETGFITHQREAVMLRDPEMQNRLAAAYAQAIRAFFEEPARVAP